jgi:predicted nucleotidyltransferase
MSIAEIQEKIRPVLEEYEVGYAGVFGSVARGDDSPESDVDIVVSMSRPVGVYRFMELKERLEQVLGRKVDLVSRRAVNKYIRPYMERDVATVYGKG